MPMLRPWDLLRVRRSSSPAVSWLLASRSTYSSNALFAALRGLPHLRLEPLLFGLLLDPGAVSRTLKFTSHGFEKE